MTEVEVAIKAAITQKVVLAFNENPEPVAEAVKSGIRSGVDAINRYPFATEERVMQKLAHHFKCPEDNLMLVRGIDECFDRISAEFPHMRYAIVQPGFDGYAGRINVHRLARYDVRLNPDFSLNLHDLAQISGNDFVFLANPSNPTGKALTPFETRLITRQAGKVLIDETYVDYSEASQQPLAFGGNKLVFRSFSKSYGLAGLRLGVVFAEANLITAMKAKQWFCNVGVLDLCALEAALEHDQARQNHVANIRSERSRVTQALREMGYAAAPSEANFVLVPDPANKALRFLASRGVQVKDTRQFGLADHMRISIGLPEHNDLLLTLLAEFATPLN